MDGVCMPMAYLGRHVWGAKQHVITYKLERKGAMRHSWKIPWLSVAVLWSLSLLPAVAPAQTQMGKVKHVFIILMENHNWTGDNSAASAGNPDIKGSSLAPYINNTLIQLGAHAEQYFNPPGNHPSLPNYLWLEAGTNFGVTADDPPGTAGQTTTQHLVTQLVNHNPAVTWRAYAEPDYPNADFTDCPQDFNELDVNHVPFAYFSDTTNGFSKSSPNCIAHVVPYSHLATDLAAGAVAQYNFITPNLCHDGHEGVSPCAAGESSDNTRRTDDWLSIEVPKILNSAAYRADGALFILWDEAEDGGNFSDGPIGMFVLSPFARTNYQNSIHYDHNSMVKTIQEIFGVTPLLGGAANSGTNDLSDFFLAAGTPTLTSISVAPASATIAAGAMQPFIGTGTYSDGTTQNLSSTATWSSSNTAVATISAAGEATGIAAGTANITAAQGGVGSNTAVLTVTAVAATLRSIAVTPASASIAQGATQAFTATGTYSDGITRNLSSTVTWSSSNTAVATISAAGVATGAAAGTVNITAAQSGVGSNTAVLAVAAPEFVFSASNGTPTSMTVTAGQVATYHLELDPLGGFTGAVSLACSGAPEQATCSVSPSVAAVNNASAVACTVTVTTTARAMAAAVSTGGPFPGAPPLPTPISALTLAAALRNHAGTRRSKPVRALGVVGVLLACVSLINACGGGGSTLAPPTGGTAAGSYTLTVTGTSSGVSQTVNLTLVVN
jgi:hypothetical protein